MIKSVDSAGAAAKSNISDRGEKAFAKIGPLIAETGGLSLSQVCVMTGIVGTTIQNWVKRGWVAQPKNKKYELEHVARILLLNALKDCIQLEHISLLIQFVNETEVNAGKKAAAVQESTILNALYQALAEIGSVGNMSRKGVEAVAKKVTDVITDINSTVRTRLKMVLIVMVLACVCTDVKRRTEAMMWQILHAGGSNVLSDGDEDSEDENSTKELHNNDESSTDVPISESSAARRTVSQALRELDQTFSVGAADNTGEVDIEDDNTILDGSPDDIEKQSSGFSKPLYFKKD